MYIYCLPPESKHTELMIAFQQGKSEAYTSLYHQFAGALRFYVEQLVKDHQVAEDIASETLIKTFNKHSDFGTFSALKGFLYITASNAALDYLKIRKRHDRSHEEIQYLKEGDIDDIEFAYIRTEALRSIYDAIETLPDKPREVIQMLFIEGKKLPEIAEKLNLSYNTVQNYRGKGLELIRIQLIKNGLLSGGGLWLALSILERH